MLIGKNDKKQCMMHTNVEPVGRFGQKTFYLVGTDCCEICKYEMPGFGDRNTRMLSGRLK